MAALQRARVIDASIFMPEWAASCSHQKFDCVKVTPRAARRAVRLAE
jgi:hypothetical protein